VSNGNSVVVVVGGRCDLCERSFFSTNDTTLFATQVNGDIIKSTNVLLLC